MRVSSSAWIVNSRYDTMFFTASLGVPLLLWAGFSIGWLTGVAVYALFQLLFNMPHNFQTWTISVLDPTDRVRHRRRYAMAAVVTLGVLGLPMYFSPQGVYPWVRTALLYWGYYHLVRQHYGFLRIYERHMGDVPNRESRFYARFVDGVCYLPLFVRFRDPELMTIHVGDGLWTYHPILGRSLWVPIAIAYGLLVLIATGHHIYLWRVGRRNLMPRALLLLSVTLAFALATLVIEEFLVAVAVVTAYHNLQYLGLTWFHNRNRAQDADAPHNPTISWIRSGKVWLYVLVTMFYGVVLFLPRIALGNSLLTQLPVAFMVAMHYYVDARIWRFPLYPERGRWLQLGRPSSVRV